MDELSIAKSAKKNKRTPNTACFICKKPLYRRPFEFSKSRYFACIEHRAACQSRDEFGLTEAQEHSLALPRQKGKNYLNGIPKSEESKIKRSRTMKKWCEENPDKVFARAEKNKGELHYQWKGGVLNFNQTLRQMVEHRRWTNAVRNRDRVCRVCGTDYDLDSHHIVHLATLIEAHGIKTLDDAREYAHILWDVENGIALCKPCHYKEHGIAYSPNGKSKKYQPKVKKSRKGKNNANWKGGLVEKQCVWCSSSFLRKTLSSV